MWTRPAPCDVTFTIRWRRRSERIEPRAYSADASVDHTSITPKRATTSLADSVDPTEASKRVRLSVHFTSSSRYDRVMCSGTATRCYCPYRALACRYSPIVRCNHTQEPRDGRPSQCPAGIWVVGADQTYGSEQQSSECSTSSGGGLSMLDPSCVPSQARARASGQEPALMPHVRRFLVAQAFGGLRNKCQSVTRSPG
jgi:hypothetical protein